MSKAPTTKSLYATRDFRDAGTEKSFEGGKVVEATPGELANYEAAGLVSEHRPDPQTGAASDA